MSKKKLKTKVTITEQHIERALTDDVARAERYKAGLDALSHCNVCLIAQGFVDAGFPTISVGVSEALFQEPDAPLNVADLPDDVGKLIRWYDSNYRMLTSEFGYFTAVELPVELPYTFEVEFKECGNE